MSFPASTLALVVALAGSAIATVATDAQASVSIAVAFEPLVKDSTAIAVFTPIQQTCVWENSRIYTYTRLHTDNAVAGDVPTNAEVWVRTLGGVVGHVGQSVDGEPVFTIFGRPSLLFLHPGAAGSYDVTARAQGQYPVTLDETTKEARLIRSRAIGVLLPPRPQGAAGQTTAIGPPAVAGGATAPATATAPAAATVAPLMAADALHGKRVDDAAKDIAAAWKRLHLNAK